MQDVQHCLDGGVGEIPAVKVRLDRLHVRGSGLPEHSHNLEFEGSEGLIGVGAAGQADYLLNT